MVNDMETWDVFFLDMTKLVVGFRSLFLDFPFHFRLYSSRNDIGCSMIDSLCWEWIWLPMLSLATEQLNVEDGQIQVVQGEKRDASVTGVSELNLRPFNEP